MLNTGAASRERVVDEVLAESFPASDPPSWTSGIVRPGPVGPPAPPPYRDEINAERKEAARARIRVIVSGSA